MSELQQGTVTTTSAVEGVAAPAPEKIQDDSQSKRYAALARKEQQLRQMQIDLKAKEDLFKQKDQEYSTSYIPKQKLLEDPLTALHEIGVPLDKLASFFQGQQNIDPTILELRNEIRALKDQQTNAEKTFEQKRLEEQQRAYDQAIHQIKNDVKALVSSSNEYEIVKATGSEDAVVELIKKTYDEEQVILSVEEATKQVEEYLLEETYKVAQLDKIKARLLPPAPEVAPAAQAKKPSSLLIQSKQQAEQTQQPQSKTLSNAVHSVRSSGPLTEKERKARAIAAFRGEL